MKTIPMQNSETMFAVVDDEDYEHLSKHKWSVIKNHKVYYARRFEGPKGNQRLILMHREIMGNPEGVKIDHRNGDGLLCVRANLREATNTQNATNRRIDTRNKSGVTGVCWYPQINKWQCSIMINKKRKHLGHFANFEDAVAARKAAEQQHYGEFVRQPEPSTQLQPCPQ